MRICFIFTTAFFLHFLSPPDGSQSNSAKKIMFWLLGLKYGSSDSITVIATTPMDKNFLDACAEQGTSGKSFYNMIRTLYVPEDVADTESEHVCVLKLAKRESGRNDRVIIINGSNAFDKDAISKDKKNVEVLGEQRTWEVICECS
jgi:hypothetical protein